MVIGERLRALREQKGLSLGDIEKRSGLKRPYISRVEHGHTVPFIDSREWRELWRFPSMKSSMKGRNGQKRCNVASANRRRPSGAALARACFCRAIFWAT